MRGLGVIVLAICATLGVHSHRIESIVAEKQSLFAPIAEHTTDDRQARSASSIIHAFSSHAQERNILQSKQSQQAEKPLSESKHELASVLAVSGGPDLPPSRKYHVLTPSADDLHYMVTFGFGTPPNPMKLILDLGSSDLMVFGDTWCNSPSTGTTHVSSNCFKRNDSSTFQPSAGSGLFLLNIDGELVTDRNCALGQDVLRATFNILGTTVSETFQYNSAAVRISSNLLIQGGSDGIHAFADNDGLIGAAYNSLSNDGKPSPFLTLLTTESDVPTRPVFALDLNPRGIESRLYIDGIDEQYRDRIQWSDISTSQQVEYHEFRLFDLNICGVSLFDNDTNLFGWPAIVDTGASCLSLPAELFDMVTSWLPLRCVRSTLPTQRPLNAEVCELPEKVRPVLPTLNFRLQQNGGMLHLPLEDLLLAPPTDFRAAQDRRICIVKGHSVSERRSAPITISFGTRTLRSLFTVLSMPTTQVGFAEKVPTNGSNVQCLTRKVCKGMQTHYEPLNMCQDPECSNYYFFTLDSDTKTCNLSTAFHVVAITLITAFIVAEVVLNEVTTMLTKRVYRTVNAI